MFCFLQIIKTKVSLPFLPPTLILPPLWGEEVIFLLNWDEKVYEILQLKISPACLRGAHGIDQLQSIILWFIYH